MTEFDYDLDGIRPGGPGSAQAPYVAEDGTELDPADALKDPSGRIFSTSDPSYSGDRSCLAFKNDHVTQGLSLLIQQFKGKPRIEAFLTTFLDQIQELEEAFIDLWLIKLLSLASGVHLADIGNLVGQPNSAGLDDDDYRQLVRARILANRSNGDPDTLIAIVRLVFPTGGSVEFTRLPDASFILELSAEDGTDDYPMAELARIINRARAGGVHGLFQWSPAPPENTFTLADGNVDQVSTTQGFPDEDGNGGGVLAWASGPV